MKIKKNSLYNIDCRIGLTQMIQQEFKVNMIITSPPYWKKRVYDIKKDLIWEDGSKGQLGQENNFHDYINHLHTIFQLCKDVLKEDGSLWVNIADTYGGSGNSSGHKKDTKNFGRRTKKYGASKGNQKFTKGYEKSLLLIPQRFAIKMIDSGWLLRNVIIWKKTNPMPENMKDRFTNDFEYLYFFTKNKDYYFEQQFEEYTEPLNRWGGNFMKKSGKKQSKYIRNQELGLNSGLRPNRPLRPNKKGRNKRAVWEIPTKSHPQEHFAIFPNTLIKTPIISTCREGGIVLDIFAGIGTTLKEAWELKRDYIGFELSKKYYNIAKDRLETNRITEFI